MLQEEIEKAQSAVRTDAYQLSVGEIINMYKDRELIINPDFQRLFRWEIGQKSRLIESLLLGIPVPSIFVFERSDSTWELVDGLQRVSTLLEFMSLLRNPDNGMPLPPSALVATKYLPSLSNAVWEVSDQIADVAVVDQRPLESSMQLAIRRARLNVEILKRPSDNLTKYELFQRLNAGGTLANAQELRNCVIIMVSSEYSKAVRVLAESEPFLKVLSASEDQLEKQRHMEYVCRFLVHTFKNYDNKLDVEEFIDEGVINLATACDINSANYYFTNTFNLLDWAYGKDALRRRSGGAAQGRVLLAAFECIAVGISRNLGSILAKTDPVEYVRVRIAEFWSEPGLERFFTPGLRGTSRIQRTVPFGTAWFAT